MLSNKNKYKWFFFNLTLEKTKNIRVAINGYQRCKRDAPISKEKAAETKNETKKTNIGKLSFIKYFFLSLSTIIRKNKIIVKPLAIPWVAFGPKNGHLNDSK